MFFEALRHLQVTGNYFVPSGSSIDYFSIDFVTFYVRCSRPSARPDLEYKPNPGRVLSFTNPDTIHFLNKTHFKYSFVKDNYPYENIYVYITLT